MPGNAYPHPPGRSRRPFRLAALFGLLLPAACTEPAPLCDERAARCLSIESYDIDFGGQKRFEVRLANICREEIEYKLCFEVPGEEADCRQGTLETARRAEKNIPLSRFGGRTRVFVRYVREAKACRFPLTPDVAF